MTLIEHLRGLGMSGKAARDAMQSGKVRYCGVPTAEAGREVDPTEVTVDPNAPRLRPGRDPAIVWRDPHLVVVWKPAGLLAVPAPRRQDPNVLGFVGKIAGKALPVHRLDEGTSGLLMVALDVPTQEALKAALERHAVDRRYLALAKGAVSEAFTVESRLVRDRGDGKRGSGPGGKPAVTHFRRVGVRRGVSLVEARLETGRTHQVRIHLAERKHPILGDTLYADAHTARQLPRLALHAWRLAFAHPASGREVVVEAPLADDLDRWWRERG